MSVQLETWGGRALLASLWWHWNSEEHLVLQQQYYLRSADSLEIHTNQMAFFCGTQLVYVSIHVIRWFSANSWFSLDSFYC
jgi:hypothetical protein